MPLESARALPALTAIPVDAFERPKVSARKLLVSTLAGHDSFRSTDPRGYLMPDLSVSDSRMGWSRWGRCTTTPEQGMLCIEVDTISLVLPHSTRPDAVTRVIALSGETIFVLKQSFASTERTLPADATVQQTAARIAQLSGLTDGQLASLFNVTRETFQRWRTGQLRKPTDANRRRLGLLARLLEDVAKREAAVDQWLRNVSDIDGLSPYELLERGRLDDAELLAAQLPGGPSLDQDIGADGRPITTARTLPAFASRRDEHTHEPVAYKDDEDWVDVEADIVEDDDE